MSVKFGDIVRIEDGEEARYLELVDTFGVIVEIDDGDSLPYLVKTPDRGEWWVENVSVIAHEATVNEDTSKADREIRIGLVSGQELVFNPDEVEFSTVNEPDTLYVTSVEGSERFSHYAINGANVAYVHQNFE